MLACLRTWADDGTAAGLGRQRHGSLTARLTLAERAPTTVRYVQTPKAKWTYLRVAAGTGRARYLNELPGRSGARRGRGQPAWLRFATPALLAACTAQLSPD